MTRGPIVEAFQKGKPRPRERGSRFRAIRTPSAVCSFGGLGRFFFKNETRSRWDLPPSASRHHALDLRAEPSPSRGGSLPVRRWNNLPKIEPDAMRAEPCNPIFVRSPPLDCRRNLFRDQARLHRFVALADQAPAPFAGSRRPRYDVHRPGLNLGIDRAQDSRAVALNFETQNRRLPRQLFRSTGKLVASHSIGVRAGENSPSMRRGRPRRDARFLPIAGRWAAWQDRRAIHSTEYCPWHFASVRGGSRKGGGDPHGVLHSGGRIRVCQRRHGRT